MIDWIVTNIEWVFSGFGTTLVIVIIGLAMKKTRGRQMSQKSGHSSTNIQVGGDIKTGEDG